LRNRRRRVGRRSWLYLLKKRRKVKERKEKEALRTR